MCIFRSSNPTPRAWDRLWQPRLVRWFPYRGGARCRGEARRADRCCEGQTREGQTPPVRPPPPSAPIPPPRLPPPRRCRRRRRRRHRAALDYLTPGTQDRSNISLADPRGYSVSLDSKRGYSVSLDSAGGYFVSLDSKRGFIEPARGSEMGSNVSRLRSRVYVSSETATVFRGISKLARFSVHWREKGVTHSL